MLSECVGLKHEFASFVIFGFVIKAHQGLNYFPSQSEYYRILSIKICIRNLLELEVKFTNDKSLAQKFDCA